MAQTSVGFFRHGTAVGVLCLPCYVEHSNRKSRGTPAGCLKTSASAHKAVPTELQRTLNLMAANVHFVFHQEPAAPYVNKQYNFTALHFTPPPPHSSIHHNLFLAAILCKLSFWVQTFSQIPSLCTRGDGMLCSLL